MFPHREHSFLPKHAVFQLRGWLQGRGDRVLRGVHVGPWEILETRVALSSYSLSLFFWLLLTFLSRLWSWVTCTFVSIFSMSSDIFLARVADGLTAQMHLHSPPTSYQSLIKPLWIVLQEKKYEFGEYNLKKIAKTRKINQENRSNNGLEKSKIWLKLL